MLAKKIINVNDPVGYFKNNYGQGQFILRNPAATIESYEWDIVKPGFVNPERLHLLFTCRESLAYYWCKDFPAVLKDGMLGFYYRNYNSHLDIKSLNEFFKFIDNKLNLPQKTWLYRTNVDNLVMCKLSDFWMENECKRGFFSLFLRMGAVHYYLNNNQDQEVNFNHAINRYLLASKIKKTIKHFLNGNTVFNGEFNGKGLISTFNDGYIEFSDEYIAQKLTKPIDNSIPINNISVDKKGNLS